MLSKAVNLDLIKQSKQREKRKNRERGNYSKARVIDAIEVGRRKEAIIAKI